MTDFVLDREENRLRKGQDPGYQHFLRFRKCLLPFHGQVSLFDSYLYCRLKCFNPLPDDEILDWSKLKQSADNNFEHDVNSRKFSKLVENTVGKGQIARYEQFLLFPQCFQKACFPEASKGVIVWEWVKPFLNDKF